MSHVFSFQWQNPFLLETIYKMRALKLRDFLLFDYEVQLWSEYYPIWVNSKDQIPAQLLPLAKRTFEKEQQKLRAAVIAYDEILQELKRDIKLDPKHDYQGKNIPYIQAMHKVFRDNFDGFSQAKQFNYIRDRVVEFEGLHKNVERLVTNKKHAIAKFGSEWALTYGHQAVLDLLCDFTRPMVAQELDLLRRFFAAFNQMKELEQKRKTIEADWEKKKQDANRRLRETEAELLKLDKKLSQVVADIQRMQQIHDAQQHRDRFLSSDIRAEVRNEFPQVDPDTLFVIHQIHKQIRDHFAKPGDRSVFLQERINVLENFANQKPVNAASADLRRAVVMKELEKLKEFQLAYARIEKPQDLQARLQTRVSERNTLETQMAELRKKQGEFKANIENSERWLSIPKQEQIVALADFSRVQILDIVKDKLESYSNELAQKSVDQLLDEIVHIFVQDPVKYPLWLQYMVIHFSGMRYKSAHGSWQDAKRMLIELRRQTFLQGQEGQDLEQLSDQQALDRLAGLEKRVPAWMWRDIVRLTELKVNKVKAENWEQWAKDEIEEMYRPGSGKLRQALFDWKKVITVWREEHRRTRRLIVSSAVCNEVAEHIQHLRGVEPSGGLTGKVAWYLAKAKSTHKPENKGAYFVKSRHAGDFKEGASIFWLRWVRKYPNEAQVTQPLFLPDGDELVRLSGSNPKITIDNNDYKRVVRVTDKDSKGQVIGVRNEDQWLRWMHEATVVKVIDSAEGTLVFTFETSLPDEPRSESTMGLSRRYLSHLIHDFPANDSRGIFVACVPDGKFPYAQLKEMLDWNKILLRDAFTPAEIEAYWQKVEQAAVTT
jgi:hypothetical protein